uniref:OmpW/AlkL family protein n=1 Tax=uncultured Paracoccus sp. TaxID=189685 RepID=UPI0025D9AFC9
NVNPKSDNGTLAGGTVPVSIGDNTRPSITVEYFIRDNLGVELLGALPFKHSIKSNGAEIGSVKHLPPVVSLQYHFDATPQLKPFVGVGVNFTGFYDAESKGPLAGNDLRVKNSWGLAAHLGADYWINDRAAVRADLRWIDIDADVTLNGADIGQVEVDPVVAGISYVMKF